MISKFVVQIPAKRIDTIERKIRAFEWNLLPDAGGWKSGVGIADLKRLLAYWLDDYDWSKVERGLNQLPHYTTDIEGEHLHFLHFRGTGKKPPILLLHGWPGSFIEFEKIWQPLAADGHDIVVPSLPGFAFSTPITGVIGPRRAATLMHALMARLAGSRQFIVQGGDWGSGIAAWMAHDRPDAMLGIHLNMADLLDEDTRAGTAEEQRFVSRRKVLMDWETGYNHEQETRPQTLAVAMSDSPVGAAAWILEKFGKWADLPLTEAGDPDIWSKFSEEQLITNMMLYIATNSFATASWIYHGKRLEQSDKFPAGTRIELPTGFAAFRDPVFIPPPRSYVEQTFNVVHWTGMPAGGHFAAWEAPELLLSDIRTFAALLTT